MKKNSGMTIHSCGRDPRYGGVGVRIVFAAVTLVVIAVAIGFFLYTYQQQVKENHRNAGRISEYGLQAALERLSVEPSWSSGFPRTDYNGGWYAVTLVHSRRTDTAIITMTANGHKGNATDTRNCLLGLVIEGKDSLWVQRSLH